jgi:hypothetical protein
MGFLCFDLIIFFVHLFVCEFCGWMWWTEMAKSFYCRIDDHDYLQFLLNFKLSIYLRLVLLSTRLKTSCCSFSVLAANCRIERGYGHIHPTKKRVNARGS